MRMGKYMATDRWFHGLALMIMPVAKFWIDGLRAWRACIIAAYSWSMDMKIMILFRM